MAQRTSLHRLELECRKAIQSVHSVLIHSARDCAEQAFSQDVSEANQRCRELLKAYILAAGPLNTHANIGAGRLKKIARFDSLAVSTEIQRELDIAVGLIYPDAFIGQK